MITLVLLLVMSAAILAICFWPHLDEPRDDVEQGQDEEDGPGRIAEAA